MRRALLTALLSTACSHGGPAAPPDLATPLWPWQLDMTVAPPSPPPASPASPAGPNCSNSAPASCPPGEQAFDAPHQDYQGFCAKVCNDDRDCPTGVCVKLFDMLFVPPVCIGPETLVVCPSEKNAPATCCLSTTAACDADGNLDMPLVFLDGHACGWEKVHCPAWCQNPPLPSCDSTVPAHCP